MTFVELHGHRIVSVPDGGMKDGDGWTHEAFALINPRRIDGDLVHDGVGKSIGTFPTLGLAIAECKKRCPPPPMPKVEIEYLEEV